MGWGCDSRSRVFSCMCKVLSSVPSTGKKKKKTKPVILTTQEAEIRRISVWSQPQANSSQEGWPVAQAVKTSCLASVRPWVQIPVLPKKHWWNLLRDDVRWLNKLWFFLSFFFFPTAVFQSDRWPCQAVWTVLSRNDLLLWQTLFYFFFSNKDSKMDVFWWCSCQGGRNVYSSLSWSVWWLQHKTWIIIFSVSFS
jgi:hypothetical protein